MDNGSFETVSLGDYVGVVWRRKWIVLLVTLLVTAAAFLYARNQQQEFSSTASVLYSGQAATQPAASKNSSATSTWGTSNVDLASTPGFATFALAQMKQRHAPADVTNRTGTDLLNETTVATTPSGNGLTFTVQDPNPATAMALANGLAQGFPAFLVNRNVAGQVAKLQQQAKTDLVEASDPSKYQIFNMTGKGKIILYDSSGHPTTDGTGKPQVNQQAVAQLRLDALKKQSKANLLLHTPVDASAATNTYSRSASAPVQTAPQVAKTTLIGFFVGLVLGVILAFIQDVLDTRIRSAEDVGRRLRIPLLARIPAQPRRFGRQPVMLAEPTPVLVPSSEAYRIAKLNLSGLLDRRNARTLMFTSAAEDEGTSQTVANMAIVLARAGRHVIVVDANMRSPMQAEFFGLDDRAGLSDVLSGHAKLADTLTAVEVSRVHDVDAVSNGHAHTEGILEVLPAGSPAADPAELLDTRTAADLLLALRQRADVVLVDAPAILPVTDAMVLASKVDAVVVVSRARRASRPNVVAMRRALDNCPAPAIGFVFTGDASGRRNDYGGSYVARPAGSSGEEERDPREVGVL